MIVGDMPTTHSLRRCNILPKSSALASRSGPHDPLCGVVRRALIGELRHAEVMLGQAGPVISDIAK